MSEELLSDWLVDNSLRNLIGPLFVQQIITIVAVYGHFDTKEREGL